MSTRPYRRSKAKASTKTTDSPPLHPSNLIIWECPNCGQSYFGETPPDICAYCRDLTTWRKQQRRF